jgi:hypothetical protein
MMLNEEDLKKPRPPKELSSFIEEVISKIGNNKNEQKEFLMREGLYKKFYDEIRPLSLYFSATYNDLPYLLSPSLSNQDFDAVVTDFDGKEKEYIEVTWPRDGRKIKKTLRLRAERGFGPFEIYTDPVVKMRELFELTIAGAEKKSRINYYRMSGCFSSLVLAIDLKQFFYENIPEHHYQVSWLVTELSKFNYKTDKVFLLLMHSKKLIKVK